MYGTVHKEKLPDWFEPIIHICITSLWYNLKGDGIELQTCLPPI